MDTDRCSATSKRTGERCKRRPVPGAAVCKVHGGGAPRVRAKAAQRVAEVRARQFVVETAGSQFMTPCRR